jgi:predicted aspartyl protease
VSIHYPLSETFTPDGLLLTPHLALQVSTKYGWRPFRFLLDTGADYTVVPESLAELIGIDLTRCRKEHVFGNEDRPVPARVGSITIHLGSEVIALRCHFLNGESAPYLLGRMDLLTRFNIFFHNDRQRITFNPI